MPPEVQPEALAKRVTKGLLWNQFAKVTGLGLGFCYSIVLARGLGATDYGIYATIISFIAVFHLLLYGGFEQILTNYIPKLSVKGEYHQRAYLAKKLLLMRGAISLVFSSVIFFCSHKLLFWIGNKDIVQYFDMAAYYFFFEALAHLFMNYMTSLLKIKIVSLITILVHGLNLSLAYLFIQAGYGVNGQLLVIGISSGSACIIYAIYSTKSIWIKSQSFATKPLFKFGFTLWLISFVQFLFRKQMGIILLTCFLVDSRQIGFYNLAVMMTMMGGGVLAASLDNLVMPTYSETYAKGGTPALCKAWRLMLKLKILLCLPLIIFMIFFASDIITILYDQEYEPTIILFQVFAVLRSLAWLTGGGINTAIFYVTNNEKYSLYFRFATGLINLLLAVFLISHYGVMGAIVATGLSVTLITVIELVVAMHKIAATFPIVFTLKVMCTILLAGYFSSFLETQTTLSLLGGAITYSLVTVLLFYTFKLLNNEDKDIIRRTDRRLYKILKIF